MIHVASVAVSREHRRAKTERLDSELLKRAFLGWLRGERNRSRRSACYPDPERRAICSELVKVSVPADTNGRGAYGFGEIW